MTDSPQKGHVLAIRGTIRRGLARMQQVLKTVFLSLVTRAECFLWESWARKMAHVPELPLHARVSWCTQEERAGTTRLFTLSVEKDPLFPLDPGRD